MTNSECLSAGVHRLATFLAGYVIFLITAGGLVKSLEAGLSVPDWPLSYGMLNPPRWWEIESVRAEHGHRLLAGIALLLTVWLVVWIARREQRQWVRRLAYMSLGAVLAQAALGGITVLFFLPKPVSVAHAGLAQLYFCFIVTLAVVTSRWWLEAANRATIPSVSRSLVGLAVTTTVVIYVQILIGAVMRHAGAGLAIPDFPFVFGGLVPPSFDFEIGIHYVHRIGAVVVTILVFAVLICLVRQSDTARSLLMPGTAMAVIVLVQASLGAATVLTAKAVLPNTLHVGTGALLLGLSLVVTLASQRFAWIVSQQQSVAQPSMIERLEPEVAAS